MIEKGWRRRNIRIMKEKENMEGVKRKEGKNE